MRARTSFALTTLTMLFFVQGLRALFAVLFAFVYEGIYPALDAGWLLLALLPIAALSAPALPFSLWIERSTLLVAAAVIAAVARVPLTLPSPPVRTACAVLVVGAGAVYLGKAVGFLERRSVAAGMALALVLDQLLSLAGWSYDLSMRPAWLPAQLVVSAAAIALALRLRREPFHEENGNTLERRAGGVRLRGAVALACLLFLELNVLGNPAVAHRWLGVSYPLAALALLAVGVCAPVLLLAARGPIGSTRTVAVALTAAVTAAALLPRLVPGGGRPLFVLFAAGHLAALLLLDRPLLPGGGRRRGWKLAVGMNLLLVLTAAWVLTFFYAYTMPGFRDRLEWVVIAAGLLLLAALTFSPRPVPAPPARPHPVFTMAGVAAVLAAGALALLLPRGSPPPRDRDPPRVATYNVHYGSDENWRYDPERIARTIEASGADVVALQEVPAGLIVAYGTDLALWLGRRLGMRSFFAPAINGLLGDALLTHLPVVGFESVRLPPEHADAKHLAVLRVLSNDDTVAIYAAHFDVAEEIRLAQVPEVVERIAAEQRAVFLGDLNAEPGSAVLQSLRAAGFSDAFELAGSDGGPTWPAGEPRVRIDWIWLRGFGAADVLVSAGGGSDHRLVAATLRRP